MINIEPKMLALGCTSETARTFIRVRRDLMLTLKELGFVLGVTSMALSYFERGLRNPKREIREKLRNLAFYHDLPYASSVFPEVDDPKTGGHH